MTTPRPPFQFTLDLPMPGRGEAPRPVVREVEVATAMSEPESPAPTANLMEAICDPENIEAALRAVVRNKGAPGVDGITVRQLPGILKARWPEIEEQLLQGRYQPQPVRRVQIPKPTGGTRDLGIPTVIDRVIQQAVLQRLQPLWDPTFSEHSYGFRPGRSAQQAVAQAQAYVIEGYRFVVDIDLAKFFDRVNHDKLVARVAARIPDRRVLRLIRSWGKLKIRVKSGHKPKSWLSEGYRFVVDIDLAIHTTGHTVCTRRFGGLSVHQRLHGKQAMILEAFVAEGAMHRARRAQPPGSLWAEDGRTGHLVQDLEATEFAITVAARWLASEGHSARESSYCNHWNGVRSTPL